MGGGGLIGVKVAGTEAGGTMQLVGRTFCDPDGLRRVQPSVACRAGADAIDSLAANRECDRGWCPESAIRCNGRRRCPGSPEGQAQRNRVQTKRELPQDRTPGRDSRSRIDADPASRAAGDRLATPT